MPLAVLRWKLRRSHLKHEGVQRVLGGDWLLRVSDTEASQGSLLMGLSSLNSSVNKVGQKATENFTPNYQTPLKLYISKAFPKRIGVTNQ